MFKVNDIWGIFAAMLTLIAIYLILKNPNGLSTAIKTSGAATSDLITSLQGR